MQWHTPAQCGSSLLWHEQVEFQVVTLTCCLTEGRRHQKNLLFGKQYSAQELKRPTGPTPPHLVSLLDYTYLSLFIYLIYFTIIIMDIVTCTAPVNIAVIKYCKFLTFHNWKKEFLK